MKPSPRRDHRASTVVILLAMAVIAVVGWMWLQSETSTDPVKDLTNSTEERQVASQSLETRSAPESVSAVRAKTTHTTGFEIAVRRASDDAPIPGARVRWIPLRGIPDAAERLTDEQGAAFVPPGSDAFVLVTADGYLDAFGKLAAGADTGTVKLASSGSLRVEVTDEMGRPASNVKVALIPPSDLTAFPSDPTVMEGPYFDWAEAEVKLDALTRTVRDAEVNATAKLPDLCSRLQAALGFVKRYRSGAGSRLETVLLSQGAGFVQSTSDDGTVIWPHLACGEGYRWAMVDIPDAELTPPFEKQRFEPLVGGFRVNSDVPQRISGLTSVEAGKRSEGSARVFVHGSVRGSLLCRGSQHAGPAALSVHQRDRVEHPLEPKTAISSYVHERGMDVKHPGEFEVPRLKGGLYDLRAKWRDSDGSWYFVMSEFELAMGESKDLGTLTSTEGQDVDVEVVAVTPNGTKLEPKDVFADVECVRFDLILTDMTKARPTDKRLLEFVWSDAGSILTLKGLPAGDWTLTVDISDRNQGLTSGLWKEGFTRVVAGKSETNFRVPETKSVEIPLVVARTSSLVVNAVFPNDADSKNVHCMLVPKSGDSGAHGSGSRHMLRAIAGSNPTRVQGTVTVVPGRYRVVCWSDDGPASSTGYFGSEDLEVHDGAPVSVDVKLEQGCRIRGRASVKTFRAPIVLASPSWAVDKSSTVDKGGSTWIWMAPVSEDGAFELRGVPARSKIVFSKTPQFILTGEPGTDVTVELQSR